MCSRRKIPVLPALFLGLFIAVSAASPAAAADTLDQVRKDGFVRVAFANEAPFGYATPDGKLTGEAPEIAKAVYAKMGIQNVDGVLTEWGSLIPGLAAKRFHTIAAGMFITPKRCQQIAFSEPTYCIGQAFLVRAGNPKNLHSYEDVKDNPDVKLGVMAGAVERDYAREIGIPDSRVVVFPDPPAAAAGVKTGRVDAMALTSLSIQNLVDTMKDPSVERAEPFTNPVIDGKPVVGCGGFGFHKKDKKLLDEFNRNLLDFRGTEEHIKLVEPFGFTEADLPKYTAEQLCSGEF